MTYQQLDKIADIVWLLYALSLLVTAFWMQKSRAWAFVLRSAFAIVVVQQLSKLLQKRDFFHLGHKFPSTHFAVVLAIATCFWILSPKTRPVAVIVPLLYGALMLFLKYHTPVEMLGAFFVLPLAMLFHFKPRQARPLAN